MSAAAVDDYGLQLKQTIYENTYQLGPSEVGHCATPAPARPPYPAPYT